MPFTDWLFGKQLASDEEAAQRVGTVAAIPMLGLDALSSAAYGPEAALTLLIPLGLAGLSYIGPITGAIVVLLFVVYFSYRQTIAAYPPRRRIVHGGQGELGDYVRLVGRHGSAAGLRPCCGRRHFGRGRAHWFRPSPRCNRIRSSFAWSSLALITIVNLRGVRESGVAFVLPTYIFIVAMLAVLAIGVVKVALANGPVEPVAPRRYWQHRRR